MNQLSQVLTSILRQLITGFFFTCGGMLAIALFARAFKIGICP